MLRYHSGPPALFPAGFFPVLLLLFLLAPSPVSAQSGYEISDVLFEGNEAFDSGTLTDLLLFPGSGWFGRTFLGDEISHYSAGTLEQESESLLRFYRKEGFLNAEVRGSLSERDDGGGRVEIMYRIDEGTPVFIRSVTFQLDRADGLSASEVDSLRKMLETTHQLGRGKRFRDADLNGDRPQLLYQMNDHGFPYATIGEAMTLTSQEDSVDIAWMVVPGPRSFFGPYSVEGAVRFDEDLIHDRIRFSPGGEYRQSLLEATRQDIYDLTLYRTVSLKAALGEQGNTIVPVSVKVQEHPWYRFRVGVGYGRDEEFRVSGRVDFLGIFGTAGQVGLEVRRSALEPITVLVSYLHPDFLLPKARFTVQPFLRREDEPGYEARRSGYEVGLAKPLGQNFFASAGYAYESAEIFRTPDLPLPSTYRSSYPKEAVVAGIGYMSATPLFAPTRGISIALSATYSGLGLFWTPGYHLSRVLLDFRWYTGVTDWAVLATRLKLGSIASYDSPAFIPFEERFYSGGSVSVRGWARSSLGPLDAQGRPVGGSSLLETGLELRFPRDVPLHGVLFVDAGNVWETPATMKPEDLAYAAGAGLRYATPIGPLRFDVAHPLFKGSQRVQWWFSIGHAF